MTVLEDVPAELAGWTGRWVAQRLDARVVTIRSPIEITVPDLVGLALRRNPKRAHLLVSPVLGKHVPAAPGAVHAAGLALGALARAALTGAQGDISDLAAVIRAAPRRSDRPAVGAATSVTGRRAGQSPVPCLVLGYAETATALGHIVADALDAPVYLHSTRRAVRGIEPAGGFVERHSHAVGHRLLPADPAMLRTDLPVVLVDDELSTGHTALGTIALLQGLHRRRRYVVATLVDARTAADCDRMAAAAAALEVDLDVVALTYGQISLAAGAAARARRIVARADPPAPAGHLRGIVEQVDLAWPADLPVTGRHGFTGLDGRRLDTVIGPLADRLAQVIGEVPGRLHVLGVEELMYVPLRLAMALAERLSTTELRYSSTTRSPVLVVDHPGYPIRQGLVFSAHDGPAYDPADDGRRYVYNVVPGTATVLLLLDRAADTAATWRRGGLVDALAGVADRVLVATLGRPG
jgi:hypothetical protein